ncbi:MAG: energy-coupled thiamine transporter ThiT, partial [Oscillospiraceae bacterium]|nr:energy-coupled thiamine transporter ThiT [Oscillospiraceae bacterium]
IILFDYIVAYTVIGFSGMFSKKAKNFNSALVLGIGVTFFARFLCHFITGWAIWDALWPNDFGMIAPVYSLCYNGSYMLAEAIISSVAGIILFKKRPDFFQ